MHREILSSLIILRQKIHSFHWEVEGESFLELHKLFETIYTGLLEYADRIAEYMRTKDQHPPCTLKEMLKLSLINENENVSSLSTKEMIEIAQEDILYLAESVNETPNESRSWSNIADDLSEFLMKYQWFLRSYIQ